jgi:hypothetical protein
VEHEPAALKIDGALAKGKEFVEAKIGGAHFVSL